MEINGKDPLAGLNSSVQRLDGGQQPTQRIQKLNEEQSSSGADRIEFSVKSREVLQIDNLIRSTPDIREQKVEQIRSAIANGTYNVKAEMVAEKIITGNMIDNIY
jgi:negative regulator of flagellin synthesis FlgM